MDDLIDAIAHGPELYVLAGLCVLIIVLCSNSLWRDQRNRQKSLSRILGRVGPSEDPPSDRDEQ
jgi:hypothetical protein